MVVGAVLNVIFSSIQTLDRISIVGWVGLAGIMSSIITLAVAVGVQDRPSAAPQVGFWSPETAVARDATFVDAINAVSVVVFAYAGTPNFFNIVGEMKNQRDYTKSVITCQAFVTAVYLVSCDSIHLASSFETISPRARSLVALCITSSDSTLPLLLWAPPAPSSRKSATASLCLVCSSAVFSTPTSPRNTVCRLHNPMFYRNVLTGEKSLCAFFETADTCPRTPQSTTSCGSECPSRGVFYLRTKANGISSCVIVNCALSFIIAEVGPDPSTPSAPYPLTHSQAIPFFNDLVGLIGALLGTFICM